jgi:glycosyltransferase involved in cell wall biosynthesis
LLQAYSSWPRRKEVDLVVVGGKWSKKEVQHLAKLGITDRVHLLRDVDDQKLCLLYNQATAFVYPSIYEGFGIPLLEAMACGCPIIASRIPSTLEVAGECPIYFEPTEAEDLLAAFDIALSEGRASERVRSGLEQVKCYSWDKTARWTLEVYRALWESHSRRYMKALQHLNNFTLA